MQSMSSSVSRSESDSVVSLDRPQQSVAMVSTGTLTDKFAIIFNFECDCGRSVPVTWGQLDPLPLFDVVGTHSPGSGDWDNQNPD